MLCRDTMPGSNNSAPKQRECGFDGIGVNRALNVDAVPVLDGFVFVRCHSHFPHSERVGGKFVGDKNVYVLADVLSDVFGEVPDFASSARKNLSSPPFADTNNDFFILPALILSPANLLAADVGFVHFYGGQLAPWYANAMAGVQRGLVRDFAEGRENFGRD
jgi:hypothetical protein